MSFMKTPCRRYATAVTCTAVALAAALPAAAPAQTSPPAAAPRATQVAAPVPKLDWSPCGEDLKPLLCATADVPTDYDHPDGPTTRLALAKLPASGTPDQRLGTLFI